MVALKVAVGLGSGGGAGGTGMAAAEAEAVVEVQGDHMVVWVGSTASVVTVEAREVVATKAAAARAVVMAGSQEAQMAETAVAAVLLGVVHTWVLRR